MRRVPTITTQADSWATEHGQLHPWLLPLSVDAGGLDREGLAEAVRMVVARHEALRAIPVRGAAGRAQFILDPEEVEVEVIDIVEDDRRWHAVHREPWPLERARWIAGIIESPMRRLVLKVCHSVTDQIGLQIVAADLAQAIGHLEHGRPLTWRPPVSFTQIAEEEASPAGQARLARNNDYVRRAFAPGWITKPMPELRGPRRNLQIAIAVSWQTHRAFIARAREIGVPWQSLMHAAIITTEEIIDASGVVRVQDLHHNRNDDDRRRCVGNFASYVPTMMDARAALDTPLAEWAHRVHDALAAAAEHWPVSDLALADPGLGVADDLRDSDGGVLRAPHLEIDLSSTALRPGVAPAGSGDRIGEVVEVEILWRPTEIMLYRREHENVITVTDHTQRRSEGCLRLFATCLLGCVERFAGVHPSPAGEVFDEAHALRRAVGPAPTLEWRDDELVAATAIEVRARAAR